MVLPPAARAIRPCLHQVGIVEFLQDVVPLLLIHTVDLQGIQRLQMHTGFAHSPAFALQRTDTQTSPSIEKFCRVTPIEEERPVSLLQSGRRPARAAFGSFWKGDIIYVVPAWSLMRAHAS